MKDYDFIETHKPINNTARKVLTEGIHYDPKLKDPRFNSDCPIELQKIEKVHFNNPFFVDYTGLKYGKFTVMGLIKGEGKNMGMWLVKCSCGQYETRRSKSIKNHQKFTGKIDTEMCMYCEDLEKLRIRATAKSLGYSFEEYVKKLRPNNKSIKELELELKPCG